MPLRIFPFGADSLFDGDLMNALCHIGCCFMLLLTCPAQASDADAHDAEAHGAEAHEGEVAAESAWEAAPASAYSHTFSMALVDSIVLEGGPTCMSLATTPMSAIGTETYYISWTFLNHRPCAWTPRCTYLAYVPWI